jgi:hypothetical protein
MTSASQLVRRRVLIGFWLLLLVGGIAAQGLLIANHATWQFPTDPVGVGTVFAITYGSAGTLILLRRPGNAVGWVFLYITAVAVLGQLAGGYSLFRVQEDAPPCALPDERLACLYLQSARRAAHSVRTHPRSSRTPCQSSIGNCSMTIARCRRIWRYSADLKLGVRTNLNV